MGRDGWMDGPGCAQLPNSDLEVWFLCVCPETPFLVEGLQMSWEKREKKRLVECVLLKVIDERKPTFYNDMQSCLFVLKSCPSDVLYI